MASEFQTVYRTSGQLNAESIKLLLESAGIQVLLAGESIGSVYGLGIGPLAEVEILVPSSQVEVAQDLLTAMENGDLELPAQADPGEQDPEGEL
jgi:hypothetical protein